MFSYIAVLADEMDEVIISQIANKIVYVPPIKLLQKTSEFVHNLMKSLNISTYSVKKISIGIEILCETVESYNSVLRSLQEKKLSICLYGPDNMEVDLLKNKLIERGLKCIKIKKNYKGLREVHRHVLSNDQFFTHKSVGAFKE